MEQLGRQRGVLLADNYQLLAGRRDRRLRLLHGGLFVGEMIGLLFVVAKLHVEFEIRQGVMHLSLFGRRFLVDLLGVSANRVPC